MTSLLRTILICLLALVVSRPSVAQGLLPRAISQAKLEAYLRYLPTLSDEQRTAILRLHSQYRSNWDADFSVEISAHNARWRATFVSPEKFVGPSMEESYRDILKSTDRLRYKLQGANDAFFDQIELILTESQLARMQRVRLAHDRSTYRRDGRGPREREIDIVELVDNLDLSFDVRQRIDDLMMEFEPVFVEALKEAAEADLRSGVYDFAVLDLIPNGQHLPDLKTQHEVDDLMDKGERVRLRSSKRLVQVIRTGLLRFAEALPPEFATELQQRYNELAYSEVYPDPASVLPYFDEASKVAGLSEEQRGAIGFLRNEYLQRHEALSKKMAENLFQLSLTYFKYDPEQTAIIASISNAVADLGLERETLNKNQPARIRAILLPEQTETLSPWKFENSQPPRPWTRGTRLAASEGQGHAASK